MMGASCAERQAPRHTYLVLAYTELRVRDILRQHTNKTLIISSTTRDEKERYEDL